MPIRWQVITAWFPTVWGQSSFPLPFDFFAESHLNPGCNCYWGEWPPHCGDGLFKRDCKFASGCITVIAIALKGARENRINAGREIFPELARWRNRVLGDRFPSVEIVFSFE